jgi:hypothetical protein
MKKTSLALAMLVTMVMAVGLQGTVMAKSSPTLPAPTGLTCDFTATPSINWDDLIGATKYSVEVVAGYDTSVVPDGVVDVTLTFSFGTGNSGSSELDLSLGALTHDFGLGAGPQLPIAVDVQVKGLNPPGKSQKSQNNPFTDPVTCTLPTPV